MRKYLLAGTSAFALALTAGAANADSTPGKFDIKISGDAYFEAGAVAISKDRTATSAANTAGDFINRFRLQINPEAVADNGLKYGGVVRIRANSGSTVGVPAGAVDGDKAYIYVSGAFGSAQAGVTYGPSDVTYVGHPNDWQMLGAYDQWKYYAGTGSSGLAATAAPVAPAGHAFADGAGGYQNFAWGQFGNGASGTAASRASEGMQLLHSHDIDTKVVYYTPRFFGSSPTTGLQGAVSYAPHVGDGYGGGVSVNTGVSRGTAGATAITGYDTGVTGTAGSTNQQTTAFRDVFELTANYNEKFGDWSVKGSLGYEAGKAMGTSIQNGLGWASDYNDLSALQVGALVGWRDFQLGGGFVDAFKSGYVKNKNAVITNYSATDQISWNVGGQYTWGPAVFGVKYLSQKDSGDLSVAGNRTLQSVTAGTMYTVAPGLRTGLEYTYFAAKSDMSMTNGVSTALGGSNKQTGSVVLARGVVSF